LILIFESLRPNTRMQPDRFAREIVAILTRSGAARLRRLMRNPFGGSYERLPQLNAGNNVGSMLRRTL
jgi:hypothetical protein